MTIEQKREILKRSLYEGEEALAMYTKYENAISVPNGISTSIKVFLTNDELQKLSIGIDDFGNPLIDVNDDDVLWLFEEYEKLYNFNDFEIIEKGDNYTVINLC